MGLRNSGTHFTARETSRPFGSDSASCGHVGRLRGAVIKPRGVLLANRRAPGIGSIALAAALCSSAVPAALASAAVGPGFDLDRANMSVTGTRQDSIGHKASVPAPNDALPMLPGTGKETRNNDNHVLHTRLAGLSQRSDPTLQFGQGLLWLNHTEQGAQGVGISVLPLNQNPQRLTIDGVYVDYAVGSMPGSPVANHNRAWSLAINSRWLSQRLTLHGEYAQSRRNHSAWASLHELQSDRAYSLLAKYADQTYMLGSRPLGWGLTLSWQQAGRTFWSPTARDVSRDKAVAQAAAEMHWGGVDARLSFAQAMDNVADDAEVPTLHMNTVTADLHYTAQQPIGSAGLGRLFTAPSYALSLKHERSSLGKAPVGETVDIPDRYLDMATLTARFTPGPWWWEVSYRCSMVHVPGHKATDLERNRTQLNLHLPLSDWLKLTPALQWSLIEEQGSDNEIRMIGGTLGGSALLIPDRLAAKLDLRAQRRYSSRQQVEDGAVAVESSLDWTFQPQQGNRPNVTISLRGSYRYADSSASNAAAQYQAFSGIQLSWPSAN
ncbi:MAG: hypothetical protein J5I81_09305 [Nitrococcus mobilis]|nr:hypothetical protein [Nitrococcus mobilis]